MTKDDRFYIHTPDGPDTPPTRPKKPTSRKSSLLRKLLSAILLLILALGMFYIILLYLPKLLLDALPVWQELFSVCPPKTLGWGLLWVIPGAIFLAVLVEFAKLILTRKPYKTIANGAYAFLSFMGNTLKDAVHIFIPEGSKKEEASPKDPTIPVDPVDIDPEIINLINQLDSRLEADFAVARKHKKEE